MGAELEEIMHYPEKLIRAIFITDTEESTQFRTDMAKSLSGILVLIMILLGLFEFQRGNYEASVLHWFIGLFFAAFLFFMQKQRSVFPSLTVAAIYFVYFSSFVTPLLAVQTLFWFPIVPLISLFILGRSRGIWWTVLFLLGNSVVIGQYYSLHKEFPWPENFFFYTLIGFVVIFFAAFAYEGIKVRLEKGLRTRAESDYLTNILNRYKFFAVLDRELERFNRYNSRFSLLMFDIDHFKRLNDEYGHITGDNVLKKLTEVVSGNLRKTDVFARYGGEEFMILALETPVFGAARMAEKLRSLIANTDFSDDGNGTITVSFGVTAVVDSDTAESLVKRADEALYNAKKSGRNRVVVYSSEEKEAASC